MFLKLRLKPNIRKVLKKQGLELGRREYEYLCYRNSIIVNAAAALPRERLNDGINVIEVVHKGHSAKFWVEVYKRRVIRAYTM